MSSAGGISVILFGLKGNPKDCLKIIIVLFVILIIATILGAE